MADCSSTIFMCILLLLPNDVDMFLIEACPLGFSHWFGVCLFLPFIYFVPQDTRHLRFSPPFLDPFAGHRAAGIVASGGRGYFCWLLFGSNPGESALFLPYLPVQLPLSVGACCVLHVGLGV
jgi:hypothetical protein